MRLVAVGFAAALAFVQAEPAYRITDLQASSTDIATELVDLAVQKHRPVIAVYNDKMLEVLPTPAFIDTQIVPLVNNLMGRHLWDK